MIMMVMLLDLVMRIVIIPMAPMVMRMRLHIYFPFSIASGIKGHDRGDLEHVHRKYDICFCLLIFNCVFSMYSAVTIPFYIFV